MQVSEDKLREQVLDALTGLKDDNPDNGFIIVTVGAKNGREHILTYSNLPDESVKYVAALIVDMGEEVEHSAKKRRKLH
jgi:hypothetical protein